jgi:signal transduction histidine kinase
MLIFLGVLVACSALGIILAGLLALLRNQEKADNQWFFALCLVLGTWLTANYADSSLSLHQKLAVIVVKVDFSLAMFVGWCLIQFAACLANGSDNTKAMVQWLLSKKFRVASLVVNFILIALIVENAIFSVGIRARYVEVNLSSLSWLYLAVVVPYLLGSLLIMIVTYMRAKRSIRRKMSLIILGFLAAIVANLLTNLVFPNFISAEATVKALNFVGYMGILVLVLCMYVAIATRRLFDVRLTLLRGLAYAVLVSVVAAVYAGLITLSSYIFLDRQLPNLRLILISLVVALLVTFTFQYLRKYLDKVTNRIFFQDSYDFQTVVDQISAITTTTIRLEPLLSMSEKVLRDALKANYCTFILVDDQDKIVKFTNDDHSLEVWQDFVKFAKVFIQNHRPVVDALLDDQTEPSQAMRRVSAEILYPLFTTEGSIGYMVLGSKQTGVVYVQRDLELLSIVASSLSLAIRNAYRFQEVEQFNQTLQQKVDEATRKLRHTNDKLRTLDQTKDDFISMASHQLRTPLTSVKGYVSMVIDGDAGPINPMQRRLLDQSFTSAQRMVYLIADLLNISRLKTGRFVIETSPANLAQITKDEVSQLVETAKGRGLTLTYDKPHDFPTYMLDTVKIRQVIMNFVDNAIYYTPSGGHIHVQLSDKPKSIELRVIDDGIGVPKNVQHHLFTKFYRAPNAQKARPDGTGLGLFMAKKVVLAQGGALIYESVEGKGSVFGFSFAKSHLQSIPKTGSPS